MTICKLRPFTCAVLRCSCDKSFGSRQELLRAGPCIPSAGPATTGSSRAQGGGRQNPAGSSGQDSSWVAGVEERARGAGENVFVAQVLNA